MNALPSLRPIQRPIRSLIAHAMSTQTPHRPTAPQQRPILLLDVMDTLVADPFYTHMPSFFDLSFQELLSAKHPTAWLEFEKGQITEDELFAKFFIDGRPVDGAQLVAHIREAYRFVDGMEELLKRLYSAGYQIHAFSNYPSWFQGIEEKLALGRFLDWTFVSCQGPMKGLRKPSPEAFEAVVRHLEVPQGELLFVDDREQNVEAGAAAGIPSVLFRSAEELEAALREAGLQF